MSTLVQNNIENNQLLLSRQHLWMIKLRYLWLAIQILLITVALIYGYLDKKTFTILFPLTIIIILANIKLHFNITKQGKNLKLLNYQIEGDLILFVIFLIFSGGTQNPFYPFFYLLVFLLGITTDSQGPWIRCFIVFASSFSLQILPFSAIQYSSILSAQTFPYLLIQFAIPLITYFIAHSLGKKLNQAYSTLERIQRREDRMSRLKALGAMSAGLSHEFASPLHAAQLRLERFKRSKGDDEDINECLLALEDCSTTLHLMGKIHRDLDSTLYEEINENSLREIIKQWHQVYPEAILKININKFLIHCPSLSFIQTLFNVLDNAYEAQDTTPVIEIYADQIDNVNLIIIKDSGPGFPNDVLTRWGQPFNTHRLGGVGLGLYSCELFMNSIGGEIQVRNEVTGASVELRFL